MPLMACPQCGQNVSSLASVCPKCSYSLREQRLREGQRGPQIVCRKCGQKISAEAHVCPHCGVDFPKRTFNLLLVAAAVVVVILAFVVIWLLPGDTPVTGPVTAPPPLSTEPPEITPPHTEAVLDATAETSAADSNVQARPIVVESPPPAAARRDTPVRATTRWTANWVNVRQEPNPDAAIVQVLKAGVRVDVGAFETGFWEVYVEGQRLGYVANSLLLREPPQP